MVSLPGSVGSALKIGKLTTFIHPESQDAFYLHVRMLLKQGFAQKCRLRQIVIDLVGNAVKFTGRGSVALSVDYRRDSDDPGWGFFQFTGRDTGIGITEEQRERIFRAFSQGDASITRRFGGTGLGLVISAMLTLSREQFPLYSRELTKAIPENNRDQIHRA